MKGDLPLISIGLPVYNSAYTLPRVLDSLLSQTYRNLELIISDNASSDETPILVAEYAKKDSRIRYIRRGENLGSVNNFFLVFSEARGKYFMWAAGDDGHDPRFIESLLGPLESHTDYGVSMCSYERIAPDGIRTEVVLSDRYDLRVLNYHAVFKKMMQKEPISMAIYGLFRTDALRKLLARPLPYCIGWDRVFMCEVALAMHMYTIEPVLFYKYTNPVPVKERGEDSLSRVYNKSFPNTRFLWDLLVRLITSRSIPWQRKLFIPVPWLRFFWRQRQRVLLDFKSVFTIHGK